MVSHHQLLAMKPSLSPPPGGGGAAAGVVVVVGAAVVVVVAVVVVGAGVVVVVVEVVVLVVVAVVVVGGSVVVVVVVVVVVGGGAVVVGARVVVVGARVVVVVVVVVVVGLIVTEKVQSFCWGFSPETVSRTVTDPDPAPPVDETETVADHDPPSGSWPPPEAVMGPETDTIWMKAAAGESRLTVRLPPLPSVMVRVPPHEIEAAAGTIDEMPNQTVASRLRTASTTG